MTELLRHYIEVIQSIKNNTYRPRNGVYQQNIKRTNKKRRDRTPENNDILFTN